jgi:ribonucleoside-diphosphate reductase alpha chain
MQAIGTYVSQKAGIGQEFGRLRGIAAPIRGGEVIFTGAVGYVKAIQSLLGYCSQGGLRKGSATLSYPIWHCDVESFLPLKNNKGLDENRARFLDYAVSISKLFLLRYKEEGTVTLFDPQEVPELYSQYGLVGWDELYSEAEEMARQGKYKRSKVVSAVQLIDALITERAETGRIYILFIDHANSHSSFLDKIWQSNLCLEVTLPTTPFETLDDTQGEISTCVLAAINVLEIESEAEFEEIVDLEVRALNEVIDIQTYPYCMAELPSKARRPIGIGIANWAALLAKRGLKWGDKETLELMHKTAESLQYYALKSSNEQARESGAASLFRKTKYSLGILPIDTYKSDVDKLGDFPLRHDWEMLRESIRVHGLRNSTLTCQMPCESSSVIYSGTNGIEAPRGYVQSKGNIKTLVPGLDQGWEYELQWSIDNNRDYTNICAILQKFIDQSISADLYYNPSTYEDNRVPMTVVMRDFFYAYKMGLKSLYYHTTNDGNEQLAEDGCEGGCKL